MEKNETIETAFTVFYGERDFGSDRMMMFFCPACC